MQSSRQIILGILLFGVISVGYNSDTLLAFGDGSTANHGDIGSTIEFLEFSTTAVSDVNVLQITGDIFAVAYVENGDGKIATYTVSAAGVVQDNLTDGPDAIGNGDITDPQLFHITGDIYGIIYSDNGLMTINTFDIDNAGTITAVGTGGGGTIAVGQTPITGLNPDIVHMTGTVGGDQFYAIAYTSGNAGRILPISINAAGTTITHTDVTGDDFTQLAATAREIEIIKLVTDTQYAAVYHAGGTTGTVTGFDVPDDGTGVTIGNSLNLDAGAQGGNTATVHTTATGITFDIQHITGTVYALAYVDSADAGIIETMNISNAEPAVLSATGTSNNNGAINYATSVTYPTFLETFDNLASTPILVAYRAAADDALATAGSMAFASHTIIVATGEVEARVDQTNLDTLGINPSLVHRSGNNYLVGYEGPDGDGFVRSFNLGAADGVGPLLDTPFTYVSDGNAGFGKADDIITITITANEDLGTPVAADLVFSQGIPAGTSVTFGDDDGDKTLTATVTVPASSNAVQAGEDLEFTWKLRDTTGNESLTNFNQDQRTGGQAEVVIDTTAPTVTALDIQENGDGTTGSTDYADENKTIEIDLVASEPLSAATATVPA